MTQTLADQRVVVLGLGASGVAACRLLSRRGARVWAVDEADSPALEQGAAPLRSQGVTVHLGATRLPGGDFDRGVVSPGVPPGSPLYREALQRGVPLVSELELGYEQSLCPCIAITGTNGKTTTTELVERVLRQAHRRTVAAGNIGTPLCDVVEQTRELDYVTLEVSSFQLERISTFRPAIAVLLNLTPDHLDRYAGMTDYTRAKARVFLNQEPFDWAIVQSEALAQLRGLGLTPRAKVLTFSANSRQADLVLDRGLLVSRVPDWPGPLMDQGRCGLIGPHNAENLMAALAVGRVLRLPREEVVSALLSYPPAPHRCELVAEVRGVRFINDSKATNVDAVHKAILAIPSLPGGEPNIWLIAGGKDKGFEYHDLGPLLSRRVKGAFLIGETRERIRAAWGLFTPCSPVDSLLEAVREAAKSAVPGDVVLLSPACSSFDQFRNYQHRGEVFRQAVEEYRQGLAGTPRGGGPEARLDGGREVSAAVPEPRKGPVLPGGALRDDPAASAYTN